MDELTYLLKGFRMLTHKELRAYVLVPLLINVLLCALFLYWGAHEFDHLMKWLVGKLPTWLEWLTWLLWILFSIGAVILFSHAFSILANLVGAPFNSFLSARVEKIISNQTPDNGLNLWQEVWNAIARQCRFIIYYLAWAILTLVLFFIPGINVLATPIWFLLNAWMMSIQYLDYPMDNNRISFRAMRAKMGQQRIPNLGFGSTVLVATMIPLVNCFVMPAAVIGATLFYLEKYKV